MALTTTNFNVSYLLGSSPMVFKFVDIEDYASQGVSISDINGKIKVTAPSGVVYDGTLDIDGSVSRINTTTIQVPLLSDGTPEVGLYSFEYEVTDGVDTVSTTKNFTYSYSKPTASNTATVDCLSPELTGSDTTNYLVNGVTPDDRFVLVSSDSVLNEFRVSGEKVGFFAQGDTFDIIGGTANDGEYTITGVEYDQANDQTVVSVANVGSTLGAVGTLVQRRTTLYFVSVPNVQPLVGYSKTLSTNTFYSQTQSFSYDATVLYDFGGGVTISDSFYSHDSIEVDCDYNLCEVFCCVNSTYNEYMKYKCTNKTLADAALERYVLATSFFTSLRAAIDCGDSSSVDSLTSQIKEVAQCNDNCSCDSSDPVQITGIGGSGSVVVASGGNGIDVATSVDGNTTTYTLTLNQATRDKIDAIANTYTVIGGTGVTVVPFTDGSNTQYTVNIDSPAVTPKEFMAFNVEVTNMNTTPSFTPKDVVIQGSNFQTGVSLARVNTTDTETQAISVSNFQGTDNSTYKAFVEVTYVEDQTKPNYGVISTSTYDSLFPGLYLTSVVSKKESGSFEFVLLKNGSPITCSEFNRSDASKLNLNIKIVE